MAQKVSGRLRYFHASANNYRLLTSPVHIEGLECPMTMKMPGTIVAWGPWEAWCQRNWHPRAFPLAISSVSACSNAWPGLMGKGPNVSWQLGPSAIFNNGGLSLHGRIYPPHHGWAGVRRNHVFHRLQGIHSGRWGLWPSSATATQASPRHGKHLRRPPGRRPTLPGHLGHDSICLVLQVYQLWYSTGTGQLGEKYEGPLWLHTRDHLGVRVGVPQARWLQHSSGCCRTGAVVDIPQSPTTDSRLLSPSYMQVLLWAIPEVRVFGLALVDIHTLEFRGLPPIFKSVVLSKEDAGPHMAWFYEAAGIESQPWVSLISSYFGRWMLIHAPVVLVLTEWPIGRALVSSDAVW